LIDSRRHPDVKRLREARAGERPLLFIEGTKLAEELLASGLPIDSFFYTPKASMAAAATLERLNERRVPGAALSDQVMAYVSDVDSPPGVIVLARRPEKPLPPAPNPTDLWVVLGGVQLPNNAGAILRTAEAAGAAGVVALAGSVDPLGPKALRAAAGSAFRLPVGTLSFEEADAFFRRAGLRWVAADQQEGVDYTAWDWRPGAALMLGAEGQGLNPPADAARVRIPMKKPVESLNVGVTAGVLLYEARRQRSTGGR